MATTQINLNVLEAVSGRINPKFGERTTSRVRNGHAVPETDQSVVSTALRVENLFADADEAGITPLELVTALPLPGWTRQTMIAMAKNRHVTPSNQKQVEASVCRTLATWYETTGTTRTSRPRRSGRKTPVSA